MHSDALKPAASLAGGPDAVADSSVLEFYLADTRQMFDSMDPAPFRQRDLDPRAEAYIVDWAREVPAKRPLGLVVRLGQKPPTPEDAAMAWGAMHDYFRGRAVATRVRLRQLFRAGRISLVIGLAFMGLALIVGEAAAGFFSRAGYATPAREGLIIGGWVALWRPAENFLHDWWPILAEARPYDGLGEMNVRLFSADIAAPQKVPGVHG